MAHRKDNVKLEDLLEKIDQYIKDEDQKNQIIKAYEFAYEKHAGQYRKSGEE